VSDKSKSAPAKGESAPNNPLAGLVTAAKASAEAAPKRERLGTVKAGPFPVGGTGEVSVIERPVAQNSDKTYLIAEYVPASGGRSKSIPLAAVAVLAEQIA
jgi:hypothetical protein